MITVIGASILGIIGWIYQKLKKKAPPPRICGSANGPPLTSPRVKLNDGRHLAYRELGVPKEEAQYKIILCHGLDSCKDMDVPVSQVQTLLHYYYYCYSLISLTFVLFPLKCIK